jgi:hypothetical protein
MAHRNGQWWSAQGDSPQRSVVQVIQPCSLKENTMLAYTQSDHAVNVPPLNAVDSLGEARERRDARTRANMSRKAYLDAILQRMSEAMADPRSPIGDLVDRLFSSPIRDDWDYRSYLALYDGKRVGAELLCMICDCSLAAYQDADSEGF